MSYIKADTQKKSIASKDLGASAIPTPTFLLLSLLTLPASLVLPLALSGNKLAEPLSFAVCIISAVLIFMISRRISSAILLSIILFFVLPYFPSPIPFAAVIGLITSCGSFFALTAAANTGLLFTALSTVPTLSYIISLLLTDAPIASLFSLVLFPPAAAMAVRIKNKGDRSGAIALFSAVLAAEILLSVLGYIFVKYGSVSLALMANEADMLYSSIVSVLKNAVISAGNAPLTEDLMIQIEGMSAEALNSLVGLAAITAIILGAISQKLGNSVFERFELEELLNASGAPIKASLASALIFSSAHILSLTSSASNAPSFLASAALNISLVFMPLMLYVGCSALLALPKKIGVLAIAAWIGVLLLPSFLSTSVISILSLIGAACTLFSATDSWAREHYGKGEDL